MNRIANKQLAFRLTLLLCCLPSTAFALADNIVSQMLLILLAIGLGLFLVIFIVSKAAAGLVKTLAREEAPTTAESRPAIQSGLVVRVLLLALLPNLAWFYLSAGPALVFAEVLGAASPIPRALVSYGLFGVPAAVLAWRLWHTRRPSMAVGIGLSSLLILVMMTGLGWASKRPYPATSAPPTAVWQEDQRSVPDAVPATPPDATQVYDDAEQQPAFPGGPDSLQAYVRRNVHYPSLLRADQRSGTVHLSYVVGINGQIFDVQVTQSMGPAFDDEAVHVVQSLPRFSPGRQRGEIVAVRRTIDVAFRRPPPVQAW